MLRLGQAGPTLLSLKKRGKRLHMTSSPPSLRPHTREKDRPEALAVGGSKAVQKLVGPAGHVVVQEFAPSFASTEGRLVTVEDSVKAKPSLAVTMLQGLALPKDMEKVP